MTQCLWSSNTHELQSGWLRCPYNTTCLSSQDEAQWCLSIVGWTFAHSEVSLSPDNPLSIHQMIEMTVQSGGGRWGGGGVVVVVVVGGSNQERSVGTVLYRRLFHEVLFHDAAILGVPLLCEFVPVRQQAMLGAQSKLIYYFRVNTCCSCGDWTCNIGKTTWRSVLVVHFVEMKTTLLFN